jgi:hypothetical protein
MRHAAQQSGIQQPNSSLTLSVACSFFTLTKRNTSEHRLLSQQPSGPVRSHKSSLRSPANSHDGDIANTYTTQPVDIDNVSWLYALTRENDLMVVASLSFILPQRFSFAPVVRV